MSRVSFDIDKARAVHLSHLLEHVSPPSPESFPASVVLPYAYWSDVDKTRFFKSLARHSRWKPDLIAEDLGGGKTVADVCSYIELLEQSLADEPRQEGRREAYPIAYEVSDDWVELEATVAEILCQEDEERQKSALKRKRDGELKELKASLRGESEVTQQEHFGGGDEGASTLGSKRQRRLLIQEQPGSWEERYKARKQELAVLWKKEDFLSSLNWRYLKTMDHMLHNLETVEEEESLGIEPPVSSGDTGRGRDGQVKCLETFSSPHSRDHSNDAWNSKPAVIDHTNEIDNSQIDPSLLALDISSIRQSISRPHPHVPPQVESLTAGNPQAHALESPASALDCRTGLSTTPRSKGNHSTPVTPASGLGASSPLAALDLPRNLSPASRRRLRKRLWTRRKRAMENGLPISEVPMDTIKLKSGRKPRNKPGCEEDKNRNGLNDPTPAATAGGSQHLSSSTVVHPAAAITHNIPTDDDKNEDTGDIVDELESSPRRTPYGYGKLQALDVNERSLREDGLDLFHLKHFTSLMNLLRDINISATDPCETNEIECPEEMLSALSYSLLRLLRACVTHYITRLIGHVIVHKDVETRQKRRIRDIFRTGGAEEIRANDVHEALILLGKDKSSKTFFKRLKEAVRSGSIPHTLSEEDMRPKLGNTGGSGGSESPDDVSEKDDSEDDAGGATSTASFSFRNRALMILPPLIKDPQASLALIWIPSASFPTEGGNGDCLLPDEMDEAEIAQELKVEGKLEKLDGQADCLYERGLWTDIGVERDAPVGKLGQLQKADADLPAGGTRLLRFREPGGTIKSRVYIDSDEDL